MKKTNPEQVASRQDTIYFKLSREKALNRKMATWGKEKRGERKVTVT